MNCGVSGKGHLLKGGILSEEVLNRRFDWFALHHGWGKGG